MDVRRADSSTTRFTVTPDSLDDCVADLAAGLGFDAAVGITVDGRFVDGALKLVDSGIANGSEVGPADLDTRSSPRAAAASLSTGGPPVVEVACVSGPDCSTWQAWSAGRYVVGRSSSARLRLEDPCTELHHALVEIDDDQLRLTQLAGRTPIRIDGEPIGRSQPVVLPAIVTIGASVLRFRWASDPIEPGAATGEGRLGSQTLGTIATMSADPWRRVVHRAPDPPSGAAVLLAAPAAATTTHRGPPATALISAAVAVLGAGVIALVMGQLMFALFAVFGAAASMVTWVFAALAAWRSNRSERRSAAVDRQRLLDDLELERRAEHRRRWQAHAAVESSVAVADDVAQPTATQSNVWRRRLSRGTEGARSSLHVVVGRGDYLWAPKFDGDVPQELEGEVERAARLHDVPAVIELHSGELVAVVGHQTSRASLIRSMVCQLAITHGPADWQLVVVSPDRAEWRWATWLPQCRTGGKRAALFDPADEVGFGVALAAATIDRSRVTLLVVDEPSLLAVRTGPLRRFIDRAAPITLAGVDPGAAVPAMSGAAVVVGSTGSIDVSAFRDGASSPPMERASMCGISHHRALTVSRALARLVDPEDATVEGLQVPTSVNLSTVDPILDGVRGTDMTRRAAVSALCHRWQRAGHDPAPRTAIGTSADGVVEIDMVADGPHALIAGTTGAGKSELLRSMVVGFALRQSPEHLTFVLVDYKGGSTFDRCADLPHTVGVVTDLDAGLAERALISLEAELHRREQLLRDVGAPDLATYRRDRDAVVLPRLVVVIDEFAALAKELPDFLAALIDAAQRGRSLGIHLILATQRPAGVVNDDIRANTNLRLALRLNDTSDAHDVIGDEAPANFARDVPGRAALRLGPDEVIVFQAVHCSGPVRRGNRGLLAAPVDAPAGADDIDGPAEIDVAVAVSIDAALQLSLDEPHRPWTDPLPNRLTLDMVDLIAGTVDHDGVGVIDDPAAQCWQVLSWNRELGHLALVGALGSGTTSTLRAVIAERCRRRRPDVEHWYVIDARGDSLLAELDAFEHVGAVVRLQEPERLHRVLARLVAEIDRRSTVQRDERCVSLAVDGLHALRTALSSVEHASTLALLERVLADGPAAGVVTCWADDRLRSFAAAVAAETWVFRCDDKDVAHSVGVLPIKSDQPGRLRVSSCGREAFVAIDAGRVMMSDADSSVVGPAPVTALPCTVRPDELASPPSGRQTDSGITLDIGLAYDDLGTASLAVPSGDHIFIGGAAATGKTTALRHVVAMWTEACPTCRVVIVDRHNPFPPNLLSLAAGRSDPIVIVVDDADRIDDIDGHLASIISARSVGITIVAAGRLEAIRSAYGHWTRDVARSGCGLILTSAGEVDGDLLGVSLPRRAPVAARPGLAWAVDGSGHRLVQVVGAQMLEVLPSNQRGPAPYSSASSSTL